jgi:hypothetical protein
VGQNRQIRGFAIRFSGGFMTRVSNSYRLSIIRTFIKLPFIICRPKYLFAEPFDLQTFTENVKFFTNFSCARGGQCLIISPGV